MSASSSASPVSFHEPVSESATGMNVTLPKERTFTITDEVLARVTPRVQSIECLLEYAQTVLTTSDSDDKAAITRLAIEHYMTGKLPIFPTSSSKPFPTAPDRPARPFTDNTISREAMPGKIINDHDANRLRLIHSLAHIESYAIDLAWDILLRFSVSNNRGVQLPIEFYVEWLRVAGEESLHYTIWSNRLKELGSYYGSGAIHDGLWQSAFDTSTDILARLSIVHMVHEARGLDTAPKQMSQLASMGDKISKDLLARIELDEITHVGAGVTWFNYVCQHISPDPINPPTTFIDLVPKYFKGRIFGPFNTECRNKAGITEDYYIPLVEITEERLKRQKEEKKRLEEEKQKLEEDNNNSTAAASSASSAATASKETGE